MFRKGKHTEQTFSFMTMADRSPVKTAQCKKAASVRDLNEAEVRGVMNEAYDATDGGEKDYQGGAWFMVKNPEFSKRKVDYMQEVGEKCDWSEHESGLECIRVNESWWECIRVNES